MAGPRQAPEVWERVSDDEVDDASSTTTVLVGADAGAQAWTPSVNGSLRGRHGQGAQRQSVQVNYAEPGDSDWSCSEWSWTWTSESWSSDWSSDPWGQHLDLQRPGWRACRRTENWEELSPRPRSREQEENGRVEGIPLPRLLGGQPWFEGALAREAEPLGGRGPGRQPALRPDSPHQLRQGKSEARGRGHDSPEGRGHRDGSVGRLDIEPARLGQAALRPDSAHQLRQGDHVEPAQLGQAALRPDSAHQLRQGDRVLENQRSESQSESGVPTSQTFLKLHSSFPPAFHAKPGESWKDYWRTVEFWLASEGANLPPNVRAARLMQQMKERAGKIVNHLTVADVAGPDGVNLIKAEMEKSPIIRLLEHKEVDRRRQKFMRLSRYPHESLESYINRASIYRHEND